ncbi:hypothetical protein BJ170DRAFT_594434 [Xylariales sp. AK1849]|nr:hypothetical protein BJ170DRAFT_594434 [Xylariales sp. AK1849]
MPVRGGQNVEWYPRHGRLAAFGTAGRKQASRKSSRWSLTLKAISGLTMMLMHASFGKPPSVCCIRPLPMRDVAGQILGREVSCRCIAVVGSAGLISDENLLTARAKVDIRTASAANGQEEVTACVL